MSIRIDTQVMKPANTVTSSAILAAVFVSIAGAEPVNSQEAVYVPDFTSEKMLKIPGEKL